MLFNFQGSRLVRSPGRAIYFTIPLSVCQELFSEAFRSLFGSLRPAGQLRYIIISPFYCQALFALFENSFSVCPGYTIYNIHAVKRGAFMPSPVAVLKTAIVAALNILFLLLCRLLHGA